MVHAHRANQAVAAVRRLHPLPHMYHFASCEPAERAAEGAHGPDGQNLLLRPLLHAALGAALTCNLERPAQGLGAILRRLSDVLGHVHHVEGEHPRRRARVKLYEQTACIGAVQDSGCGGDACRRVHCGVDRSTGNDAERGAVHQNRNTRISRCEARQRSAQRASRVPSRGEGRRIPSSSLLFFFLPR